MKRFLSVLALLCLSPAAFALDFIASESGQTIRLAGTIEAGDYDKLITFFRAPVEKRLLDAGGANAFVVAKSFELDSNGGDVREALKIAQFISATLRNTTVEKGGKCLSSCVYLFLAGGWRTSITDTSFVGIHRPYFTPEKFRAMSQAEAQQNYRRIDDLVREYLKSIKFPDRLTSVMFATPSDRIYVLTFEELEYEIGQFQPWWDETAKAVCSKDDFMIQLQCMNNRAVSERINMMSQYLGPAFAAANLASSRAWLTRGEKLLAETVAHNQALAHDARPKPLH